MKASVFFSKQAYLCSFVQQMILPYILPIVLGKKFRIAWKI